MSKTSLAMLKLGEKAKIVKVGGANELNRRLSELGFRTGVTVSVLYSALLGDPRTYSVCGSQVGLRKSEANSILVSCS